MFLPMSTTQYFSYPGASGRFFECVAYRARLSTTACADRWRTSQQATGYDAERFEKCRSCPLGASHAGQPVVVYSQLYGKSICPRCGKYSGRIINQTRCVSCYNREREFILGANAKGTRPTMEPLLPRAIRFAVQHGPVRTYSADLTADTLELMLCVLRTTRGHVQFGFQGRSPALRQGRLF
jgi:hypothetical protein